MKKKQEVLEEVQGRCWLSLPALLRHCRDPGCQFASKCLKKSSPNRSHLGRAMRLCSGHLLVYGEHSMAYYHGMLCHRASLQLSS